MKTLSLLLLLSLSAHAGSPAPTTALSLRVPQYTVAPVDLYVTATGNDSFSCTLVDAGCLTIQGAANKLPKFLRHLETVHVGAGTFAGATISGFTTDPAFAAVDAGSGLFIDGTLANVTPATGSAAGTATSGTLGSGVTFGTMDDSTASWTVNDPVLKGALLVITGGTASGQVRLISSNTATSLTIVGPWTTASPTAGSTYQIQTQATFISGDRSAIPIPVEVSQVTTNMPAASFQVMSNLTHGSAIIFRNLRIRTGFSTAFVALGSQRVDLVQCKAEGAVLYQKSATGVLQAHRQENSIVSTSNVGSDVTVVNSFAFNPDGGTVSGPFGSSLGARIAISGSKVEALGTTSSCIAANSLAGSSSSVSVSNVRCDCGGGASTVGFTANGSTAIGAPGFHQIHGFDLANCNDGIVSYGAFVSSSNTGTASISGSVTRYGLHALTGGAIFMRLPTLTAGTAEISLDNGATTATFASIPTTDQCVVSTATLSRVCRR